MEKYGTDYLKAFLLFVITIIVIGVEVASGKFSMLLFRIGKGIQLLGMIRAIGRNWGILKEELNDLSDTEKEDLAYYGGKELDITDTEVARELTTQAIDLAKGMIAFIDKLKESGKLKAITGMIALLMLFNVNTYAQSSIDSARVAVFTATKTNSIYVNQTFSSQVTGIFFTAPDATLYMTRAGTEVRVLKTRVQGRGEQGNVDDFFKTQFILKAKDTVRFRTDVGSAILYFLLRRTTSTGQ